MRLCAPSLNTEGEISVSGPKAEKNAGCSEVLSTANKYLVMTMLEDTLNTARVIFYSNKPYCRSGGTDVPVSSAGHGGVGWREGATWYRGTAKQWGTAVMLV